VSGRIPGDRPAVLPRQPTLTLARVQPAILELWTRAGAIDALGPDRVFDTVHEAVRANASEPRRYLLNPAVNPLRSWRRPMA
jgi:hypothetical protein